MKKERFLIFESQKKKVNKNLAANAKSLTRHVRKGDSLPSPSDYIYIRSIYMDGEDISLKLITKDI